MSRRALKAINWAAIAERIPESEKNVLAAFKTKSDQYLRKVQEYPESAPKIDWAHYKKLIAVPGMVDTFQKHYESMKIPFPADNYTKVLDAQEKDIASQVEEFIRKADQIIAQCNQEIDVINKRLPAENMTMEELIEAFPDINVCTKDKPLIWPHTPEFQPEYIEQQIKESPAAH